MRKYLCLIVAFLSIECCLAQTEVIRKNKIRSDVVEEYHTVIGADKQIKQGVYRVLYKKKVALVVGKYDNDKKAGQWRYFDRQQKLLQIYNYDKGALQYEAPEDSTATFRYVFDKNINDSTKATRPVKEGGRYFGYLPYLRFFKLPADLQGIDPDDAAISVELLVSPFGRLADFKIHFSSPYGEQTFNIDPDRVSPEDRIFIPATFNGQPTSCTIMINCFLKRNGELDI